MVLGKQAKILTKKQIDQLLWYVGTLRHALRNEVIVLLSVRAGLRAKEIAELKWSMLTDADGEIADSIHLTDAASKGRSGRIIPMNTQLRLKLQDWLAIAGKQRGFDIASSHVITTERSARTQAQAIVNMFATWLFAARKRRTGSRLQKSLKRSSRPTRKSRTHHTRLVRTDRLSTMLNC